MGSCGHRFINICEALRYFNDVCRRKAHEEINNADFSAGFGWWLVNKTTGQTLSEEDKKKD